MGGGGRIEQLQRNLRIGWLEAFRVFDAGDRKSFLPGPLRFVDSFVCSN